MDIFNTDQVVIDPTKDYSTELVGEGRKYKTHADLARAVLEKDVFINQVLSEKRELEADLKTKTNMQDFLDQVKTVVRPPSAEVVPQVHPSNASATPSLTPEQIEELVQKQIANRDIDAARSRNLIDVQQRLNDRFGPNYAQYVKQKAEELRMPIGQMNDLAANTPGAFFQLMGLNEQRSPDIPRLPNGSVNTTALTAGTREVKNHAYYNNLRKTNPTLYHSSAVQKEKWEQAKLLGEAYHT